MTPQQQTITDELAGQTLAAVLRHWAAGESWSRIRRFVSQSRVRVNGVVCLDSARRLRTGDRLEVVAPAAHVPDVARDVRILYVDHHLVVVDKPSGLITERRIEERGWTAARKAQTPTLDELLPALLAKPGTRRETSRRSTGGVILVHRLDRDTSGVLVVARTVEAARGLTSQFRKHTAERVYRAVVIGHPGEGKIVSQLVRDRGDGLRGSAPSHPQGQMAITHIRELERIGSYALVECRLETGRTNQIRIHLSERNCPVCGDCKYNRRLDGTVIEDASGAPRLALHAMELRFEHPLSQQQLQFLSPWPRDLEQFVAKLRLSDDSRAT